MKRTYIKSFLCLILVLLFTSSILLQPVLAAASVTDAGTETELDDEDTIDSEGADSDSSIEEETTDTIADITHVSDDAGLFTETEVDDLEAQCIQVSEANDINAIILTINGTEKTRKQYIEDYYDSMDTVLSDAVIMLIDMDSENRGIEMQGYGNCEFTLSDDRIESVLDDVVGYLQDGDYYNAMLTYLEDVDYYSNLAPSTTYQHTEADNQNYNENYYEESQNPSFVSVSLRNLLIAVVIGAIVVFIMAFNSGGRMTADQGDYIDAAHSRILGQYDRYIHTTTTRRPKPKPQSSSGGGFGGGGVSAGGHSHSGGGRSF